MDRVSKIHGQGKQVAVTRVARDKVSEIHTWTGLPKYIDKFGKK
jgi:hypothetical protein